MPLVEVAHFPDRIQGELARGRLAADGIAAELFDAGLAVLGMGVGSVRLMVEARDAAAAAEALGG